MRRSLEGLAIERAIAGITADELDQAKQIATDLAQEEDLGSWVQANIRFHSIFHRATRGRRLAGVLLALEEAGGVFVAQAQQLHPEIRRRAVEDHFALLDAFSLGDAVRALEIQTGHVGLPLEAFTLDQGRDG
jgi:DNA-binding GntR family transcriptional regulator